MPLFGRVEGVEWQVRALEGREAVVALASGAGAGKHHERGDARHLAAACSAAACVSAPSNTSGACAPEMPYFPSMTKKGTPWMP